MIASEDTCMTAARRRIHGLSGPTELRCNSSMHVHNSYCAMRLVTRNIPWPECDRDNRIYDITDCTDAKTIRTRPAILAPWAHGHISLFWLQPAAADMPRLSSAGLSMACGLSRAA